MHNFSLPQRLYFAFLGRILAAAYHSERRRVLRLSIAAWARWISFGLLLAALFLRLPNPLIWLLFFLFVIIQFSYWLAGRMGYKQFVVDKTAVPPQDFAMLPPDQKTAVHASGVFTAQEWEETVLLRPAEYWYAALGDHIVMVEAFPGRYLYQFFTAKTVQKVQKGWLIFGATPLDTVALTIQDGWETDKDEATRSYYVRSRSRESKRKPKTQTIYFTFADLETLPPVWGSLANVMREENHASRITSNHHSQLGSA